MPLTRAAPSIPAEEVYAELREIISVARRPGAVRSGSDMRPRLWQIFARLRTIATNHVWPPSLAAIAWPTIATGSALTR